MSIRKSPVFSAFILPLALANCAIVPGPKGAGSGQVAAGSTITMMSVSSAEGATDAAALEAVRRVLNGQGYQVGVRGSLIADVSFALRERTIGFSSEGNASALGAQVSSGPHRGDALALCHSSVGRMTISVLEQSSGKLVFRGASEDLFCDAPDESKLFLLASVALRDIRSRVASR